MGWKIFRFAVAEMPLANQMSVVSRTLEMLWQELVLCIQTIGVVSPHSRPLQSQTMRIVTSEERGSET